MQKIDIMGHYDDLYEQSAQTTYDRKVEKYKTSISESITKMDIEELKFLEDIATNIGNYMTFFKIMSKHVK